MEVDISEQGQVASARVADAGSAFDAVAVDAIKAWTFRPAINANRPVASRAFVVFSFVGTTP
jgi:TonB family protein